MSPVIYLQFNKHTNMTTNNDVEEGHMTSVVYVNNEAPLTTEVSQTKENKKVLSTYDLFLQN